MSDMFSDDICEGIWEDPDQKNQLTVLLKSETDGQYTLCTSEDTGLWKRFFEKFTQADVDQFTERNRQRRVIEEKKQVQKVKAADELKDLFEAKLEAFEIDEVQRSENKLFRSKIRKSKNMIELNAWVTAILLENLPKEDE